MLPYILFSLASFAVMGGFMVYILLSSYLTAEPTMSVLLTAGSAVVAGKRIPPYRDNARTIAVRFPKKVKDFSLLQSVQT
jgi:hypothetical protein